MIGYLHVSSASHIHSQLFVYCRPVPSPSPFPSSRLPPRRVAEILMM